jgi:UPF0755 protein
MPPKKIPNPIKNFTVLLLVAALLAVSYRPFVLLSPSISPKHGEKAYIYIRPGDSFAGVMDELQTKASLAHRTFFVKLAKPLNYDKSMRTGRYEIRQGMSYKTLFDRIKRNEQTPVRLTFNNIRTKEQLAGRLSAQLMTDSASIVNLLNNDKFISSKGLTQESAAVYFIPNTYEVYWTLTPEALFNRMEKEYHRFWNEERRAKAAAIPLSETEVSTLASIVEEETNKRAESSVVAGLYINRLKKGMLLQADPTVKFAMNDFSVKRVLRVHLQSDSPYNTYKYAGLPPGPIRLPSSGSIDAVLNYSRHNYLYMCAKETLNGEHNFASTLAEHNRNARKYQQALNQRRILR